MKRYVDTPLRLVAVVLAGLALLVMPGRAVASPSAPFSDLVVPGGRNTLRVAGVPDDVPRGMVLPLLIRLLHADPPGSTREQDDRVARLHAELARLGTSRTTTGTGGDLTLPLPLERSTWTTILLDKRATPGDLFGAILLDRRASLTLHGLLAMDADTRTWLAERPHVLRIITYQPGVVSAFGRSLRIANGRVRVPDAEEAATVWEVLAGVRLSDPERFVTELFSRDGGRLAYYFDVVSHLAPHQQRAALGVLPVCGAPDLQQAWDTYQAFLASTTEWLPYDRPFLRPLFDGALLLDQLAIGNEGLPDGPRWRRFWHVALNDTAMSDTPAKLLDGIEEDGEITPGWLIVETTTAKLDDRRARFEAIRFVQRVMPRPAPASLPDVLIATRGFVRYPALMLGLERIGVTDAAVFAAAARRASAIDDIGDESRRYEALAQAQGVLALVDRAAASGYLSPLEASQLATTALAIPLDKGSYGGRIAGWLDRELLPALGRSAPGQKAESLVLRSWSGPEDVARRTLTWEGQTYAVDPAAAELQRLETLREAQGPSGLDETLDLGHSVDVVAAAQTPEAARQAWPAVVRAAGAMPAPAPNPSVAADRTASEAVARTGETIARLKKIANLPDALAPIRRAIDRHLAQALLSLSYTPHLGDPDTSVLSGDEMAQGHEFGRPATPSPAWTRPEESGDERGRHIHGSLLGLDLALARLALRRLAVDAVPPPATMNENAVDLVRENVTLAARYPVTDEQVAAVAAAITRGRQRVGDAVGDPGALDALAAEVDMSEWRRRVLPWMVRSEPHAVARLFSVGEMFALGSQADAPRTFGASGSRIDGCWCLRFPRRRPWEDVSARPGLPLVAAQVPDLGLRLAELMHASGVPASVYSSLVAMAAQEFVDRAAPLFPEDWPALTDAAGRLSRERVEDYVSGLVGAGPLRIEQEPSR